MLIDRVAVIRRAAHHVERLVLVEPVLEFVPGQGFRAGSHAVVSTGPGSPDCALRNPGRATPDFARAPSGLRSVAGFHFAIRAGPSRVSRRAQPGLQFRASILAIADGLASAGLLDRFGRELEI